jgi:DNA-binding CsgD family transcriptional regulator
VKPNTRQLLDKLPTAIAEAKERAGALQLWMELTPREREVARQVAKGQSNREIAQQLNPPCSPRSVESHRARLFDKLDLPNDNELSRWLSRHAWLE